MEGSLKYTDHFYLPSYMIPDGALHFIIIGAGILHIIIKGAFLPNALLAQKDITEKIIMPV